MLFFYGGTCDLSAAFPCFCQLFLAGSWSFGGSSFDLYDGERIARDHQAMIVTMNYRLGPLGFLSTPENGVYGNMGLLDQRAVMKWLQTNAAAFGGDPTKLTIWGESAGAGVSLFDAHVSLSS